MIVHGACWGESYARLRSTLQVPENKGSFKEYAARFLGYGLVDVTRLLGCTDQRATILGCGELNDGEAHLYTVPLPPSLSGRAEARRLIISLAYQTPIHPRSQKYRCASVWFEPPQKELQVKRINADWQAAKRGTIQHEILEGGKALAFVDGDVMKIKVNCRQDAKPFDKAVSYGIVVTLEVASEIDISVYEEIRTRLRPAVRVAPVRINK